MGAAEKLDLSGKDWFTELEAAHYCGLSLRQFRDHYAQYGIVPKRFAGKKLYARADLYQVIEQAEPWQPSLSNGATISPISHGSKAANDGAALSARLRPVPLRKFAPRKKPS
jgi:hypothetical protein